MDAYSGSLTSAKRKDYFLSEHFDLCSSAVLMQLPKSNAAHGPSHQQSELRPSAEEGEASRRLHECLPPSSTFMGRRTSDFSEDLSLSVVWSHVFNLFFFLLYFFFVQEHLGKLPGGLPTTSTWVSALPTGLTPKKILTRPRTPSRTRTRASQPATVFTKGRLTAAGLSRRRSAGRALSRGASFVKRETKTNISTSSNGHFCRQGPLSRVNVKDSSTLRTSSRLHFQNIVDYIHFYIKIIIFYKLYINRFQYFWLPFVYGDLPVSGYSVIPALNEAVFCTC